MIEVVKTSVFAEWLDVLRDRMAKGRILARVERLAAGNPGDVEPVGSGVSELRLHFGPGYRVYFVRKGETVIILLCGGDKASQKRDIASAIAMAGKL